MACVYKWMNNFLPFFISFFLFIVVLSKVPFRRYVRFPLTDSFKCPFKRSYKFPFGSSFQFPFKGSIRVPFKQSIILKLYFLLKKVRLTFIVEIHQHSFPFKHLHTFYKFIENSVWKFLQTSFWKLLWMNIRLNVPAHLF